MREFVENGGKAKGLFRLAFLATGAALALSACTTVEGTNAMVDPVTFEREVMRTTLQGVGLVPTEDKEPLVGERSPLVVPGPGTVPPPPGSSQAVIPNNASQPVVQP